MMLESWLKDGLTQVEVDLLEELKRIAARPSVQDDGLIADILLLPFLETVEASDLDAMTVLGLPWVEDGIERAEKARPIEVQTLAVEAPVVAQALMALPWVIEGPSANDHFGWVIRLFHSIATGGDRDESSPLRIAGMPFLQSLEGTDSNVMQTLARMHGQAPGSLGELLSRPPFSAGITDDLSRIVALVDKEPEFVEMVWSLPWVTDGTTHEEAEAIDRIANVARSNPRIASAVAAQDWVIDGLDVAETAFVATVSHMTSNGYDDLPKVRSKQHRAISLPLAGDVDIWVMDSTVAPPGEDLLTIIEDAARIAEDFLQEPFPVTDIILIVVPDGEIVNSGHYGSYMVLTRRNLISIPHETARYYFSGNFRQIWLSEGGAEFIRAYVNGRKGVQTLLDRKLELSGACAEYENIVHWVHHREQGPRVCDYALGEKLLLNILETIGEEAMSAGLSEVYIPYPEYREQQLLAGKVVLGVGPPSDERLYFAFLKHTPKDRKEAFQDLYRRLHGGTFVAE